MHALIDGLIANWVLDPGYFSLEKEAEAMIDIYLAGLRASPLAPNKAAAKKKKPISAGKRILHRA